MFSTIDSQHTRFVRLYVTTDHGRTFPVELPGEYGAAFDRARYLPAEPATAALADRLLRRRWVWSGEIPLPEEGLAAPPSTALFSARMRLAKRHEPALPNVQRIEVQAIRIEIFTLSYDTSSQQLITRLIHVVESQNR